MISKYNIPEYGVSEINNLIKDVLQNNFDYVLVRGEISEIKTSNNGHIYLTLKDNDSILSGVIWGQKKQFLKLKPDLGMEVVVKGKITSWSKYKTTYQIDVDNIELSGIGALLKLIEDRKKRLKAKGIFDKDKKKKIPYLPKKIGVITSPTGSVIHDIINRIKNRFPTDIDLWPVQVQGNDSSEMIIKAINGFNNMKQDEQPDVIIIARGGGSPEDLMSFNDESLALSVYDSNIPIISAIGHETDTTIIDYVSDIRASTPTAAAEIVVPVRSEISKTLLNIEQRMVFLINGRIENIRNYFKNITKFLKAPNFVLSLFKEKLYAIFDNLNNEIKNRFEKNHLKLKYNISILNPPNSNLKLKKTFLNNLYKDINKSISEKNIKSKNDLLKFSRLLLSNSIQANLNKGYAILSKNNKIINSIKKINQDEKIQAILKDGKIKLTLKKIN